MKCNINEVHQVGTKLAPSNLLEQGSPGLADSNLLDPTSPSLRPRQVDFVALCGSVGFSFNTNTSVEPC